jgi:glycosyltransferase involved in cell wall biosynthesis
LSRKKILQIICLKGIGGAENHFADLCTGLSKNEYQVQVVALVPKSENTQVTQYISSLESKRIVCQRVTYSFTRFPFTIRFIIKSIRSFNPDIVHSHLFPADVATLGAFIFSANIPWILSFHGLEESFQLKYGFNASKWQSFNPARYYLYKLIFIKCSSIIAVSKAISEFLIESNPKYKKKMCTIYHGIKTPAFYSSNTGNYFLSAGRMVPIKRLHLLIDAFRIYKDIGGTLSLKIVGSGSELNLISDKIKQYSLEREITILPFQHDLNILLQNCRALCITSSSEGLGMSAIETMSVGKPVISFTVPALNEIIIADRTGILIENNNIDFSCLIC